MNGFNRAEKFNTYLLESIKKPGLYAVVKYGTVWQFKGSVKTYTTNQTKEHFILVKRV